jgi:hypothetical protein
MNNLERNDNLFAEVLLRDMRGKGEIGGGIVS